MMTADVTYFDFKTKTDLTDRMIASRQLLMIYWKGVGTHAQICVEDELKALKHILETSPQNKKVPLTSLIKKYEEAIQARSALASHSGQQH